MILQNKTEKGLETYLYTVHIIDLEDLFHVHVQRLVYLLKKTKYIYI